MSSPVTSSVMSLVRKADGASPQSTRTCNACCGESISCSVSCFKGAHFATFPRDLIVPCILAGTSEKGCCPECGAPWTRIIETTGETVQQQWAPGTQDKINQAQGTHGKTSVFNTGHTAVKQTTGWQPTCNHDHAPIPCTVLDPFGGAGTTALVAQQLERDSIIYELSPAYCQITEERLAENLGFFADTQIVGDQS